MFTLNPYTNRKILVGGKTFNKIFAQSKQKAGGKRNMSSSSVNNKITYGGVINLSKKANSYLSVSEIDEMLDKVPQFDLLKWVSGDDQRLNELVNSAVANGIVIPPPPMTEEEEREWLEQSFVDDEDEDDELGPIYHARHNLMVQNEKQRALRWLDTYERYLAQQQ